ncbi:MAG TPA: class III lanthionine synthetase LanKC [Pseudonocardiaceae bacterium]
MDLRYEEYCFGDPNFYDIQSRSDRAGQSFLSALPAPPTGWDVARRGVWQVLSPHERQIPEQGWKIHVSAGLGNASRVLHTTFEYCVARDIPFKFLLDARVLLARNSKYAPRQASGKLITIYPGDEAELSNTLEELADTLRDEPGPYILSDLRYGAGPLYLRYGAFLEQWLIGPDGERIPAIARPDGELVPDERRPGFHVPDWVVIPEFLAPHLAARTKAADDAFPYRVDAALHFSNGGGVYRATRIADEHPVVLKEARPLAGLDVNGTDAVARLDHEEQALKLLAGIPGIPACYDRFTSWEHHFLAMQDMPGLPLGRWLAANYPLNRISATDADIADYTCRALHIVDQVERILAAIHDHGLVFGDLHNRNLLVDTDDTVSLIDFELAFDVTSGQRPGLAAPGFAAPADRTGFGIDDYALAALKLWIFFPLTVMLTLDPGKIAGYLDTVLTRFPVPGDYADSVRRQLQPAAAPSRGGHTDFDRPDPDWARVSAGIVTAITASATPHRTDRLFPGDIEAFTVDANCLAWGTAGVLHTLSACGFGRFPEYEQWLLDSLRRTPPQRAGFYDGAHGIAHVLDEFGYQDVADELVASAAPATATMTGHTLHGGLAGIGLNLLHLGERRSEPALRAQAIAIGERLVDAEREAEPTRGRARAGLMHGWSGPALLFLRLHTATGDTTWLDHADTALRRDLDECVPRADGSMMVKDGGRTLPYLEVGSAGIAIVAAQLAELRPDAPSVAALPALRTSLYGEFIIQPGLWLGRAGLILALAALRRPDDPDPDLDRALARHRKLLAWHSVGFRDGIAFPGTQLLRLSTDLATGCAGVLLAVVAATADATAALPFLTPHHQPAVIAPAP